MKQFVVLAIVLFITSVSYSQTEKKTMLKVGDKAPEFSLPYATRDSVANEDITLSSFAGKRNVILAFYPADWSGGCTKEVCTMRDNFTALSGLDAEIIGISGDYVYSHKEWANHHQLPFMLASDHTHEVAKAYASYNEDSGYNRRTVYVVDKQGTIAYMDLQYSTKDLQSFEKLQAALQQMK